MGNQRTFLVLVAVVLTVPGLLFAGDSIEGWLYSRAGVAVYAEGTLPPTPSPAPSGKCETCNGTGRVGDGRVSVECLDCGGDGVVGNSSVSITEACNCEDCNCDPCECGQRRIVGYRQVCRGNTCSLEPVYEVVPDDARGVRSDGSVCADGTCEVAASDAGTVAIGVRDSGPVRRVVGNLIDKQPVRSVVRRVRENQPVRSFIRGIRCR